ncbi:MAG: hypothetical protein QGG02_03320 [Gammaproteobacteria bacterium]|nr:hypothetical protein [Gammaproteobacteria bacterium]MDP6732153.1 hypothetical protein [Gammaproteobacteria bacterium]
MYIPRSILLLLVIIYLLFLVGVDWMNLPEAAWYRPFLLGFLIVAVSSWAHREQGSDEL